MAGSQSTRPPEEGSQPVTITFVLHDPDSGGIAVKHDGKVVWQDPTMSTWPQYFAQMMPRGRLVVLEVE
jgi:hypothetical protein